MISALFGGPRKVPAFLRAIEWDTSYRGDTASFRRALTVRDPYSQPPQRLVTADPVLWAFRHFHEQSSHAEESHERLREAMAEHGLAPMPTTLDRYKAMVASTLQTPADGASPYATMVQDVIEGGFVSGLLTRMSAEAFADLRIRTYRKIDIIIDMVRQELAQTDDRLLTFFTMGLRYFASSVEYTGTGEIPATGRLVVACNHPFPFVDDFSLMQIVTAAFPDRPWMFLANTNSLTHYFPEWNTDPHFTRHMIGLERAGRQSRGRVLNGREAIARSVEFLRREADGIFFLAADGPDSVGRDVLAPLYPGFANIAAATNATILPVLFTGRADLDLLTYDVQGRFLDPFMPAAHPLATMEQWLATIRAAHRTRLEMTDGGDR